MRLVGGRQRKVKREFEFDREKFKRLVHYVIWRANEAPGFGATKLNKVLWYSDAKAFMLHGAPITGAVYIREKYGPVPKAIMPVRQELERENRIRVLKGPYHNGEQLQFKSLIPPNTADFTGDELSTVNWWISHIDKEHTAASISDQSHDLVWELAEMGEEIPYHAIFATRTRPPNDEEWRWARERAQALGLL